MGTSELNIRLACAIHGVQAVLDAAHKRIEGDRSALPAVSLADVLTVDDAYVIGMACFALISDAKRVKYPMLLFRWAGSGGAGTATGAHAIRSPPLHPAFVNSGV
jgi:hypothetical protein